MLEWLKNILPGRQPTSAKATAGVLLRARLDSAQTNADNRRHWAFVLRLSR